MLKTSKVLVPIGLFVFYLVLAIFIRSKFSNLSSFLDAAEDVYANVGYPLIFLGAVLESMFLVGLFVPGSVVLLMGAALSKLGIVAFPIVFILGTSGLVLGYIINYILGKYGWHNVLSFFRLSRGIETGKEKLKKHGLRTILWGYFIPGSASLLSTAAGILNMNFKQFLILSVIAQSFWSLVWGTIAYFFGIYIVEFVFKYFILVLIGIGIMWVVKNFVKK